MYSLKLYKQGSLHQFLKLWEFQSRFNSIQKIQPKPNVKVMLFTSAIELNLMSISEKKTIFDREKRNSMRQKSDVIKCILII